MNIKPTPEQVDDWELKAAQYADSQTGEYYEYQQAKNEKFAELAAKWGAEQERAGWLEANAPSGWIDDLRKQAQQTTVDAARVLEWMRTPNRKPAQLAFTDGPERQAAYWIEIAQQTTGEPELPEAVCKVGSAWNSGGGFDVYEFTQQPPYKATLYTVTQMHDHYAAGVRAGMAQSQWQPIETAPKDGTKVLAYTNDGYKYPLVCQCVWGDGAWWPDVWESPDEPLSPTHWMPLLTPPAMLAEGNK